MNASPGTSQLHCATCSHARLAQLGLKPDKWDYLVALAGNPNTGKSTVFNQLTGLRQHTGNWPGKTVTRAEGSYAHGERRYKVVDLPGTYSLLATSEDEEIARNFLLFGKPDVTVVVVDATLLERNLNLTLQVLEITDKAVICLNLMDEARRHKLDVNHRRLARELGVPVIPTAARQGEGIPELVQAISEVSNGGIAAHPHRLNSNDPVFNQAVGELKTQLEALFPGVPNAQWVAIRLLDGDERIIEAVRRGELDGLAEIEASVSTSTPLFVMDAVP